VACGIGNACTPRLARTSVGACVTEAASLWSRCDARRPPPPPRPQLRSKCARVPTLRSTPDGWRRRVSALGSWVMRPKTWHSTAFRFDRPPLSLRAIDVASWVPSVPSGTSSRSLDFTVAARQLRRRASTSSSPHAARFARVARRATILRSQPRPRGRACSRRTLGSTSNSAPLASNDSARSRVGRSRIRS
jgi:hypothetical protein